MSCGSHDNPRIFNFIFCYQMRTRIGCWECLPEDLVSLWPTSTVGILLFSLSRLVDLSLHAAREYYHCRRVYHQRKLSF
jgi:hypothetical protein